jgi:hypothetical protein
MKTHELLELASLDALGLLDENEREAFDRAFAAAAPAVQAQVRREQARITRAEQYLPEVDPPVSLRAKVIAAVQQAMEAVTGARRGAASIPALLPSRGVSPVWRGAAIACAAAALVFGFAGLRIYADVKLIETLQESNQLTDATTKVGAHLQTVMMDHTTEIRQFAPVAKDASVRAGALLMIDPKTHTGYLYSELPKATGSYALVVVDRNGNVGRAIVNFESRGPAFEKVIPGLKLESGENLAILSPGIDAAKGSPLLTSRTSGSDL